MGKAKDITAALQSLLMAYLPDNCVAEPNSVLPERIPPEGLVILREGDPGEPERVLGGVGNCYYTHEFGIEVFVQSGDPQRRESLFDGLLQNIDDALQSDETLSGLIFGMTYGRGTPDTEPVDGGADVKSANIRIFVEYETLTPLG